MYICRKYFTWTAERIDVVKKTWCDISTLQFWTHCDLVKLIYSRDQWVNSSPPSAAYMYQWTGPALVQIMACRLGGAKPLSEPMLICCQLDPKQHISMKFYLKFKYFHSRKCIWKCHLRNGGYFVSASMCKHIEPETKWLPFGTCGCHFQIDFLQWKFLYFHFYLTEIRWQGSNEQQSSIGSDNGLVPSRQRAILWTNDGLVNFKSMNLNQCTHVVKVKMTNPNNTWQCHAISQR